MPNLQLHQLRVAAVAKMIVENFKESLDEKSIVLACLFHDMGNIIKSDLYYFPEFLKPEGLEYWQGVKDQYIKKYGKEEHRATELIAKEIGLPSKSISSLKNIGFSNAGKNEKSDSFEDKICNYSDMRVDPYGVVAMEDRILEGRKRYSLRKHAIAEDNFESLAKSFRNMEKQIFDKTQIKTYDITNEKIEGMIQELRNLTF